MGEIRNWLVGLLVVFPVVTIGAGDPATSAVWDNTGRVDTGFGYRDNVMRTSIAPESSAFFNASADASLLRFADSGAYLSCFALADYTKYFDAPAVGYEGLFSGTAQYVAPWGDQAELGGQCSYLYQHQVLDVSETEATVTRMLVDGHTYTLRPHWKYRFTKQWAVQLEATGLRQRYGGDLSDYWEAAARLSVTRTYGYRSELTIGYQPKQIRYDDRKQFDPAGVAIPDTRLDYWQHEVGAQWRHHWDAARRWRTTTKCSYLLSQDNGSGYFDYHRLLFSEQLRWANPPWEIKAGARVGWYFYPEQLVGSENLERSYVTLDLRVERRLGKRWLLYATAEREWSFSNDPLEEYQAGMVGAGVGVEF